MSSQIPVFNYTKFSAGIEMLAQQLTIQTRQAVRVEGGSGERQAYDQIGAVIMGEKEGRATDIPVVNTPHARRWVTPRDFIMRDFIDSYDKLKVLNDPTNSYTQAMAAAAARRTDKIVIEAALGTAWTGKEGTTSVALPASQKIAAGGAGFTLAKLQEAVQKIKSANALMPGDSLHCFYTAKQEMELINTTEVKSSDFNNVKPMTEGGLRYFYGVWFHLLEDDAAMGSILPFANGTRSCVLFARSGMLLADWLAPYGRVEWIAEKASWQVSAGMSIGATRMQETKVVQIDVAES